MKKKNKRQKRIKTKNPRQTDSGFLLYINTTLYFNLFRHDKFKINTEV